MEAALGQQAFFKRCFKLCFLVFLTACKQETSKEDRAQEEVLSDTEQQSTSKTTKAGGVSGLSLPRFVSIKAKKALLHVGPGDTYPAEWMYVKKDLPVQIVAEFDTWRKIKDVEGNQGWFHKTLLSAKRTVVVTEKVRNLRSEPNKKSKIVAKIEPQVVAKVVKCQTGWCQIQAAGYKGWINKKYIW